MKFNCSYFRKNKAELLAKHYLRPYRVKAGMGFPPGRVTNNDSETVNQELKAFVEKAQSWQRLIGDLEQYTSQKFKELENAVFCFGDYRLKREFRHLQV